MKWEKKNEEVLRDISTICFQTTTKTHGFGIDDIKFEIIHTEDTSSGLILKMEAQGVAAARSPEHIKRLLDNLHNDTKHSLGTKGIYLFFYYNKLDVSIAEDYPVGLLRKYHFRILCGAVTG